MYDSLFDHCSYAENGLKIADFISDIILTFLSKIFNNVKETDVAINMSLDWFFKDKNHQISSKQAK